MKIEINIIDTQDTSRDLNYELAEHGAIIFKYNGGSDKYKVLMTSELSFSMLVDDIADGKFIHLFTGSETRFKVELKNSETSQVLWSGFLLPDQYAEPYDSYKFFVDFVATDGIARLKGRKLSLAYQNKQVSVLQLIMQCLNYTGLNLPFNFAPAIENANVATRWDGIFVDTANYEKKSAYDVLKALVKTLGCTIFQYNNEWICIAINRKHEESILFERYENGVYVSDWTFNRSVLDKSFEGVPKIEMVSPWKEINVECSISEKTELIPEGIVHQPYTKYSIAQIFEPKGWIAVNTDLATGWLKGQSVTYSDLLGGVAYPLYLNNNYIQVNGVSSSWTDYITLDDPIYVAKDVDFTFKVEFQGRVFIKNQQQFEDGDFRHLFRYAIYSGNDVLVSNNNDIELYKVEISGVEYNDGGDNLSAFVSGKIDISFSTTKDAYLNIRFYELQDDDIINEAKPNSITFSSVSLEVQNEVKEIDEELIRDIDYTTSKDVKIEHTGIKSETSEKTFSFKGDSIVIEGGEISFGFGDDGLKQVSWLENTGYTYKVSQENWEYLKTYQSGIVFYPISPAGAFFPQTVTFSNDASGYHVNFTFSETDFNAGFASLSEIKVYENAFFWLNYPYSGGNLDTSQAYYGKYRFTISHPSHWQFLKNNSSKIRVVREPSGGVAGAVVVPTSIDFLDYNNGGAMYIGCDIDVTGWKVRFHNQDFGVVTSSVTNPQENRQHLESWNRKESSEVEQYHEAIGKVYHFAQPEPLVKIDTTMFGVASPLDLLGFTFIYDRSFIVSNLSNDLTNGMAKITMIESKYNEVDV